MMEMKSLEQNSANILYENNTISINEIEEEQTPENNSVCSSNELLLRLASIVFTTIQNRFISSITNDAFVTDQ